MILSQVNFTQKQITQDGVTSPCFQSFNNMYYYKFKKLYYNDGSDMLLAPDLQLNAKGNTTSDSVKNWIKYYISTCGTFAWEGIKTKKTVTGTVVNVPEIFTIPKYNYTDEDLNKWLGWVAKNININGGGLLNGSSAMSVDDTVNSGHCIFYLPHNNDFMSQYFTDFPSYNEIMPSNIENGIIEGMFQPFVPPASSNTSLIFSYDELQYKMGTQPTNSTSNYVNPSTFQLLYDGFDNDQELNKITLANLDKLEQQPYSCNLWDTSSFLKIGTPNGYVKPNSYYTTYWYKPLLGYPIYCINWQRIKNCRSGVGDDEQRILVESDTWWVGITKLECGFFNDPNINI